MWSNEVLGTDVFHLMAAFCIYSMLGWFVESVYMSFCNRKLTNRGFAKGPYCPIYGVGALIGYFLLKPFSGNPIMLYITGAIAATVFEFITGRLMVRLFGEAWWDYRDKPCNYQGLICLESTLAWGFYAIIVIEVLHGTVINMIDSFARVTAIRVLSAVIFVFMLDFLYQLLRALHVNVTQYRDRVMEKYQNFKARWY